MNVINIGEKIKTLREAKGLTQRNLALKLHISNATISRIEKGIVTPDTSTINQLAKFFNVSFDYLTDNSLANTPINDTQQLACDIICQLDSIYLDMSVAYLQRLLEDQQRINALKNLNTSNT